KKWTIEPFDFDRRRWEEFVRRSAPGPCPLCWVPGLPSGIAGVAPHPGVISPADNVRWGMHGDCIREPCYALPGHQRGQQQSMFRAARNSIKSYFVSYQRVCAQVGQGLGRTIERHLNNVSCVEAVGIGKGHSEKAMRR